MRKKEIVCQLLHNIYVMGFQLKTREKDEDGNIESKYENIREKRYIALSVWDDRIIFRYQEKHISISIYYDEDEVSVRFNRIDSEPRYVNFNLGLAIEAKVLNDETQEIDEEDYIDIVNNQMKVITGGDAKLEELNLIYRRYCYFSNDFKEYDKYEEEYREIQKLLNG